MYKCSHCRIEIPDNQAEGRIVKVGPKDNPKFYCMECGEPVEYIPDAPQINGTMSGAQATLISNSDNRIINNNYYGGGSSDEQIETPFGVCKKSEASFCKNCRQWIPIIFFNRDRGLCDFCIEKEGIKTYDEGKTFYEIGLYNEALEEFLKYEPVCPKNKLLEVKTFIGRCYYEQKDYKQALKYFVVASRNNFDSLYYLGLCYYYGYGVSCDNVKAIDLIEDAAQKGQQQAIAFLAEKRRIENLILHPIEISRKYGYADEDGNIVIPCKWKYASTFNQGIARIKDDNDKWGIIDKTGKNIIPCTWKELGTFYEDLAPIRNWDGKWGFINKKGDITIPCFWKDVSWDFIEGLARVQDDFGRWGYIDKTGKEVIACKWKSANSFSGGRARVENDRGEWLFIDTTGNLISNK